MRKVTRLCCNFVVVALCATGVFAQANSSARPTDGSSSAESSATTSEAAAPPSVRIYLVSGGFAVADEASETADGIWYKRGNVTTFLDRARVKYVETRPVAIVDPEPTKTASRWRISDADRIKEFFQLKFNRPLPLSAFGQSELHTRWGLDHRNGMDVGIHPDSVEGRTLIDFLRDQSIPFLVFRGPIPGVATGPHIHIGNASSRNRVR